MPDTTAYTVLYFAWVREAAGVDEEQIHLEAGATGNDLKAHLLSAYPGLSVRQDKLNLAINQEHADWATVLKPSDELAVFPPVTGG
ncbi:MAG: molybdopterin converting factor subunit 1 [Pseudomonadota bacterium]